MFSRLLRPLLFQRNLGLLLGHLKDYAVTTPTPPETNTTRLRQLMAEHKLKAKDVAAILDRTPKTVRMWRCCTGPAIPDSLLKLLEHELRARRAPQQSSLPLEQGARQ